MKNEIEKYCDFCGNPFFFIRRTARYCSDTCKTKAYNQRIDQRQDDIWKDEHNTVLQNFSEKYPATNYESQVSPKGQDVDDELSINSEKDNVESSTPDKSSGRSYRRIKHLHPIKPSQNSGLSLAGWTLLGFTAVAFMMKKGSK